ncbi:MAG: choice-of-anchor B family protein [Longimicrobiales bacterium]
MRNLWAIALMGVLTLPAEPVAASGPIRADVSASTYRVGFGGAVAVGDGEVFVGEAANMFRPGTVYIYRKVAGGWKQSGKLTGPNAKEMDVFGTSLALDGNTLFVGAGPTMVHVYRKNGTTWTHATTINASSAGVDARFGTAIAASGTWLLIGKPPAGGRGFGPPPAAGQTPPAVPQGAVYAFRRDGSGQYSFSSRIVSTADSATVAGDNFGAAVAISNGTALIGATGRNSNGGLVHEFVLEPSGSWKSVRSFLPLGVGNNDAFGSKIAMRDNYAVVSALGEGGAYGAAYIYRKLPSAGRQGAPPPPPVAGTPRDSSWVEVSRLASPSGMRNDRFGSGVAITDKEIWVGAMGANRDGGVFMYTRDTLGVKVGPTFLTAGTLENGGGVGGQVAVRGNVAAIGATGVEGGAGAVIIYERSATGAWVKQAMLRVALDELVAIKGAEVKCEAGKVGAFDCGNSSLMSLTPPSAMTFDGHYVMMNDIWGWTDPVTKKEWALVGRRDGTTFVDMSNPSMPVPVADLPMTKGAVANAWRDIKTYKDHAYIVADNAREHGMQVFDLRRLRTMRPVAGRPVKVKEDTVYHEINSAHNIVINEESGYAYSVGSSGGGSTCGGGLHMVDIRDPGKPKFAGCFSHTGTGRTGTGYSHDAQCVTYKGPDARYKGHEICIGSNETAISVGDVTDKKNPKALSSASYPNVAYAHQGWFSEDHKYFYLDDEGDESSFSKEIPTTRTLVWDMTDLENPRLAKQYFGVATSIDHNLYVHDKQIYQANYTSGLRILDIADPENPKEVSFFDTAPFIPEGNTFSGAWSVYPYFKSGAIIVNSIEQGLFIVKQAPKVVF